MARFDKINLSTGNNQTEKNAAVYMQERQPQMPVHSLPRGLTGKAQIFKRYLQEAASVYSFLESDFEYKTYIYGLLPEYQMES